MTPQSRRDPGGCRARDAAGLQVRCLAAVRGRRTPGVAPSLPGPLLAAFVAMAVVFASAGAASAQDRGRPQHPVDIGHPTAQCESAVRSAAAGPRWTCRPGAGILTRAPDRATPAGAGSPAPDAASRPAVPRASGSHRLLGAGVGFVAGAGITYLVLNRGGSTAPCDRSANQDAWSRGACLGAYALGGAAGAGLGAVVAGLFRSGPLQALPLERLRVGRGQDGSARVLLSLPF